ncbi:hypothetical protein GCM10027321_25180 [Massilia terrae]|uniref:Pyridoxamine 5'-phosphate oxidase putative domain-containing protein n=1 Tax=Massilia terrae TaxID=1811224 RepID=A0ABT2CX31_9BURK|nr:hypothetical protein [Massilia terrae]MCS0658524.1 hypothetical protein [Massilia terrae]
MPNTTTPLLDAELAAFMQQDGISLTLGSCSADLQPSIGRAAGCRVSADRLTVQMFVSQVQIAALLAHVRETGRIAAVFSSPATHRTLQLKGRDGRIEPCPPEDRALVARYRDAFAAALEPLGYPHSLIRTLLAFPDEDLAVVSFTPLEAYSATPGPNAGRALQVGA